MEKFRISSDQLSASVFQFKQFAVIQNPSVFKVNTDAVLLASLVDEINPKSILEVGCGTGVISMCLKQKYPHSTIVGIDISKEAVDLFCQNIEYNRLSNICALHSSLQEYSPPEYYDLIVSNPPFFDTGMISQKKHNINARHTTTLNFEELISHASRLLKEQGHLWIIIPSDAVEFILKIGAQYQLNLQQKIVVLPKPNKTSKRTILCLARSEKAMETLTISTLTILDENQDYSNDYKSITKDFYLKF